ncbi:MAG: hypothetical protein MK160_00270 [Rhodobacteraceae bacterium]|nr:hypothetical protein [Paracoccaceae bacterium]
MTLITPEDGTSRLNAVLESCTQQVSDIASELEDLMQQVRAGEEIGKRDLSGRLKEMRDWLKVARETEVQLAAAQRKDKSIVGDYGLDLDRARTEIGCRLARIRRCCPEGRLPK